MIDLIIETSTNLFQGFMMIGFLYCFFINKKYTVKSILAYVSFSIILFITICFFSNKVFYFNYLDVFAYITIMELYTLLLCNGNFFIRSIMPIVTYMINTVLSFGISYIISLLTGYSYMQLALESSNYRLLCIVVINLTNLFVFYLIIRFRSQKLALNRWTDVVAFIVMPSIALVIVYSTFEILHISGYNQELLAFLIIICVAVAVICVISWLMLERISKGNEVRMNLLLTQQREILYQKNTILTNAQILKISKIKHDMQNDLLCMEELLSNGQFEKAGMLCREKAELLKASYTPVHTSNILKLPTPKHLKKPITKPKTDDQLCCITRKSQ